MKIDFRHLGYAIILALFHAILSVGTSFWVFFITPMYVLGFAVILLRNVNSFLEGFIYGLIYIIPGYIIHTLFLLISPMWSYIYFDYHLWNYVHALAIGLVLLSCIMGLANSLKKTDATRDDLKIKVNFMHSIYAVLITALFLVLMFVCSKLMWPYRGITFLAFAPVILIGLTYLAMRNIFGFLNGLLHGLMYVLVGGGLFHYAYNVSTKIIIDSPWGFITEIMITYLVTFLLLAGLIGWANQMRGIEDAELLADIAVTSKFSITEKEELKNEN